jgi:hypothetical protein
MPGVLPPRPLGVVTSIVHLFIHAKTCVSYRGHMLCFGCVAAAPSVKLSHFNLSLLVWWGPLMVAQRLRYCATNRKVAGSIPVGVIGIFH